MDRVVGVVGVGSGGYVVVPEVLEGITEKIDFAVPCITKPSVLMYDITGGAYNHVFTFHDATIILATVSSFLIATIGLYKLLKGDKPKRRKEDKWIDTVVRDPKKKR
jgi:hypothetical protein